MTDMRVIGWFLAIVFGEMLLVAIFAGKYRSLILETILELMRRCFTNGTPSKKSLKRELRRKRDNEMDEKNVRCGRIYRVIKKPATWKTECKYVGQVGICKGIHFLYGAKILFKSGEAITFPWECLTEESIDLSTHKPVTEIVIGQRYKVIKPPKDLTHPERFVGKFGVAKWENNFKKACLRLENADHSSIIVHFDCLRVASPDEKEEPAKISLNADNAEIGREYLLREAPEGRKMQLEQYVGLKAKLKWASCVSGACVVFQDGDEHVVPFDCLEEIKVRPSDAELLKLITQNPERVLRIIKGLNRITKLTPVRDFMEKGILPEDPKKQTQKIIIPTQEQMSMALIGPIKPVEPMLCPMSPEYDGGE